MGAAGLKIDALTTLSEKCKPSVCVCERERECVSVCVCVSERE